MHWVVSKNIIFDAIKFSYYYHHHIINNLQYHGIVSMAVEEDSADSRTDRKAQVQVTSWGQQRSPAVRTKLQQTSSHANTRVPQSFVTQVRVLSIRYQITWRNLLQINLHIWLSLS